MFGYRAILKKAVKQFIKDVCSNKANAEINQLIIQYAFLFFDSKKGNPLYQLLKEVLGEKGTNEYLFKYLYFIITNPSSGDNEKDEKDLIEELGLEFIQTKMNNSKFLSDYAEHPTFAIKLLVAYYKLKGFEFDHIDDYKGKEKEFLQFLVEKLVFISSF